MLKNLIVTTSFCAIALAACPSYAGQNTIDYGEIHQHKAEQLKSMNIRKLPGHASNFDPKNREPLPPSPKPCLDAIKSAADSYGVMAAWYRTVIYGDHNQRVLTASAAYETRNMLEMYIKEEINIAEKKFRAAKRTEDANKLCVSHVKAAESEIIKTFNLILVEADKGNRDLLGTGLRSYTSVYNK